MGIRFSFRSWELGLHLSMLRIGTGWMEAILTVHRYNPEEIDGESESKCRMSLVHQQKH